MSWASGPANVEIEATLQSYTYDEHYVIPVHFSNLEEYCVKYSMSDIRENINFL